MLPLGLRFEFHSRLTLVEARGLLKARIAKFPRKLDEIWGFGIGRLIFLQEGLLSSPSSLFAWIGQQDGGRLEIRGIAGVNLVAIFVLVSGFGLIVPAFVFLFRAPRPADLFWSAGVFALAYLVARINHIFRNQAEPLVHLLKRVLQARELVAEDGEYSDETVPGATLTINEREHDGSISELSLREAILGLGQNHFAILSFADEQFAQVMNEGGHYRVEWRDGAAARHLRLEGKPDGDTTVAVMLHYLGHRRFPEEAPLKKVDLV